MVLIESDWNLNYVTADSDSLRGIGINRIRLEFKLNQQCNGLLLFGVLIESDWNLN